MWENCSEQTGFEGGANQYPLDCLTVANIGRAIALFFNQNQKNGAGRFLIGQDTRISGDMLVSALSAGICAMGSDVCLAGVIPTPAVAYLTKTMKFDAGIVISASTQPRILITESNYLKKMASSFPMTWKNPSNAYWPMRILYAGKAKPFNAQGRSSGLRMPATATCNF